MPLAPVDRVEILVLVDNATDIHSSAPSYVENESAGLNRRGLRMLAGRCLCCAAHGLSCLVVAHRGNTRHAVLFDTGPEDYAFERNITRLDADLGAVESIVLSHGHWDHAGALLLALTRIRSRNGGRAVPFYAHPGMFRSRGVKQANGVIRRTEDVPSPEDLTAFGAEVIATPQPVTFLDDMFFVSGEIPRVTPFERGYPGHVRLADDGQTWEPDELLMDERYLALHVAGKGLVVLSACSHAGIVNVLTHARDSFAGIPLHAVLGGLHLAGTNEPIIPQTVDALRGFGLKTIAAGHCTGWRAVNALANAFGDSVVVPSAVGKRYTF